jgi:hypothetical protein
LDAAGEGTILPEISILASNSESCYARPPRWESSRNPVVKPLSPGLETTDTKDLIETGEVQIIRYS